MIDSIETATHYRTTFVFLACFILIHGLFGSDILNHKALTFANEATRLIVLSFIYKMPIEPQSPPHAPA